MDFRPFLSNMPGCTTSSGLHPLRFTDSPQNYASSGSGGGGGSNVPTPSPRRKNSISSSTDDPYSPEMSRIVTPGYAAYADYAPPGYSMEYFRPTETYAPAIDYQLVFDLNEVHCSIHVECM